MGSAVYRMRRSRIYPVLRRREGERLCMSGVLVPLLMLYRKPLSFHSVSFGPRNEVLRRMAQIALQVQNSAPAAAGNGAAVAAPRIDSSYSEALDSVRIITSVENFIAEGAK